MLILLRRGLIASGLLVLILCGCDAHQVAELLEQVRQQQSVSDPPAAAPGESIRVASFNIQVFGQSKLNKPEVMDVLADVVRRFDIVAIQEIRSRKEDVMPRFVQRINADGSTYDFVIGERLGRTVSKEQYAFVYDVQKIELVRGSVYTVPDPQDRLHREPLAATFRVRGYPQREAFSFTLVNIHTDPDETDEELDALDDAFLYVRSRSPREDDVIVLGDLNVDARNLGQLGRLPNITWVIPPEKKTNTRGTKSYDNLVFDRQATVEFLGRGDIFDFESEFQLSRDQALRVSDHVPVWATFSAREGGQAAQLATRPEPANR